MKNKTGKYLCSAVAAVFLMQTSITPVSAGVGAKLQPAPALALHSLNNKDFFMAAVGRVRPSVSVSKLPQYVDNYKTELGNTALATNSSINVDDLWKKYTALIGSAHDLAARKYSVAYAASIKNMKASDPQAVSNGLRTGAELLKAAVAASAVSQLKNLNARQKDARFVEAMTKMSAIVSSVDGIISASGAAGLTVEQVNQIESRFSDFIGAAKILTQVDSNHSQKVASLYDFLIPNAIGIGWALVAVAVVVLVEVAAIVIPVVVLGIISNPKDQDDLNIRAVQLIELRGISVKPVQADSTKAIAK